MAQTNFNRQMNQLKYRVRTTTGFKYSQLQGPFQSTRRQLFAIFIAILIFVGVVTIYYLAQQRNNDESSKVKFTHHNHGSVVANGKECAQIGMSILKKGGTVADAAISTILCEGITCPQSSGIGGGFFMTIYIKDKNLVECLDSREVAPAAADKNLFVNKTSQGLLIAVPGELKGLWELHKKYGKLPWQELLKPVIELSQNGHDVTDYLARILQKEKVKIFENSSLKEIFVNPENGELLRPGDKLKRPKLAATLQQISEKGINEFYEGNLGKIVVDEIRQRGGILSEEDLKNYKVYWRTPLVMNLTTSEKLYSMPLPGSGAILIFILNILKGFNLTNDALSYHRIIEAFKFAYAARAELGDPNFIQNPDKLIRDLTSLEYAEKIRLKIDDSITHNDIEFYGGSSIAVEDHGTAHMSILAPNGDAISVTSTINNIFGSKFRSQTGIIFNDEMNDFSSPKYGSSTSNFIAAGKRPMSSMSPSITVDNEGHVRLIIGAAGGSHIITSIALTMIKKYLMNSTESLEEIFASKRIHHQLYPNILEFEEGFDENIIESLRKFNHTVRQASEVVGFGALVGISVDDEKLSSAFDPRRGGSLKVF